MEQMIWLAPWVLTELWFSTLETLMPRCYYTGEECDAFSLRRMAVVHAANETQRVPVTIHQQF